MHVAGLLGNVTLYCQYEETELMRFSFFTNMVFYLFYKHKSLSLSISIDISLSYKVVKNVNKSTCPIDARPYLTWLESFLHIHARRWITRFTFGLSPPHIFIA